MIFVLPCDNDLEIDKSLVEDDGVDVVEKTIWSSPAGKKVLAPTLVKMITAHRTYVEPFAGSAAVFFTKEKSDVEVISDLDPEIVFAFKTIQGLSDKDVAKLEKMDWVATKERFAEILKSTPKGRLEKLHRFLYLATFSYANKRNSFNPSRDGATARVMPRIKKFRKRLEGVIIMNEDYKKVIAKYDAKDTFFFLDPPYAGYMGVNIGEKTFDEGALKKTLDEISGRFLLTYGGKGKLDTGDYHVQRIKTRRHLANARGSSAEKTLTQLVVSNYEVTTKALGDQDVELEVEALDALVELSPEDVARVDSIARAAKSLVGPVRAFANDVEGMARAVETIAKTFGSEDGVAAAEEPPPSSSAATLSSLRDELVELEASPAFKNIDVASVRIDFDKFFFSPEEQAEIAKGEKTNPARVLARDVVLLKADDSEDERFVLGVVLEPETVDKQNDIYSAEEIRQAAYRFMVQHQNIGLMHRGYVNSKVKIVESYLSPVSFKIGGQEVKKGTWLLGVVILDDKLWKAVKAGELTGLSIGGSAIRTPEKASGSKKSEA